MVKDLRTQLKELGVTTALVTGASSGIGAQVAQQLAQHGVRVGLVARRRDRLERVLADCVPHSPGSVTWCADLADRHATDAIVSDVLKTLGAPDVVINNAGMSKRRYVADLSEVDVDQVMELNFRAPVRLTQAFLPAMKNRGSGQIVNVSSMGVHSYAYRVGAYAASKAALEFFTEALHLELRGTGVQAKVFVPGLTRTEMIGPASGNDKPFAVDPSMVAEPRDVALRLIESLADTHFISYASPSDKRLAQSRQDLNRWLEKAPVSMYSHE